MTIDEEIDSLFKKHGMTEKYEIKESTKKQVLNALRTPNITFVGFENGSLVIDYDPIH